ncbi:unnamed protein product [Closterium sp. NIES-54]
MYGSSSRASTVGELHDRLCQATGGRCGVAVDQGARQLQLTGLGDRSTAAIVTMVDPVGNAGVADTLETRLADARKRHADGEYRTIPLLIVVSGIQSQWATEHPSRPVSPRLVRNKGGVDDEVDGGARVTDNNGTKQRGVIKVDGGVDRSQAALGNDACDGGRDCTDVWLLQVFARPDYCRTSARSTRLHHLEGVNRPSAGGRRAELPRRRHSANSARGQCRAARGVSCGSLDHLHGHLEVLLAGGAAGAQELSRATGCWSPGMALLPQINYAAPMKLNQQQGQCRNPSGGGSGGGRSTMDVDEKRLTRDKGRGGGGQRRDCWICHDPDHLSYDCPDRDDSEKTSSTKDVDNSSGKSQGDGEASCSMVGFVEPTVSLAPEAGEDFKAVAAAVQANPMAVLLDSGCSHHLMGTKAVFVDMAPSDGVKHVRGFNGALQLVEGRGTVALQGEAGKWVLIPDMLYVQGVQANLLSASELKESGVQLQGDGDEMLLVAATREVLDRESYNGRVLCTDLHPCSMRSSPTERRYDQVATGLDITPSTGADPPCVSCVGAKLARHTFPDKGSDAEEALAVVHIDLCGPFRVAAKDVSLFFLLLKDRHTRFVWVMPVAKKSDVLWEFQKWLVLVERHAKTSVLKLRSDRGGEFLGKAFTDFVDGKGIVHDLTCPYTPQQNGMAEREMRTAVESVRTMLLHMGVQHHWWHLALRQAVWFMVPEQQRGGKLAPKARWGLHLGVSPESKGWEVLDLTNNKVVTSVEVIFYETLSLEVLPPPRDLAPPFPVADLPASPPVSATGNEGSLEATPVAPASGIAGSRQGAKLVDQDGKPSTTGEPVEQEAAAGVQSTGELPNSAGGEQLVEGSKQLVDDLSVDKEGELSAGEESTDSDMVEVPITKPKLRCTGRARWPPDRLSFHGCLPPTAFTAVYDEFGDDLLYDDAKEDEELLELDPDMHADPEHR